MGADWYAATVIGIKVSKNKVMREEIYFLNNCKCKPKVDSETYPEAKFCPACGKYIKCECSRDITMFDEFDPWEKNPNIAGWPVYAGTDGRSFYIGILVIETDGGDKRSPLPDLSKLDKFKEDMKKIGLWDEKEFGLWTVLYCSY